MDTKKERIMKKIRELEDPRRLELLENWLDATSGPDEGLSAAELDPVMEGYSEYQQGNQLGHDEVQDRLKKWFSEG